MNLIDWSSKNNLAVALNRDLYIWNASTKDISLLFSMDNAPAVGAAAAPAEPDNYISSVAWIQKGGNVLAVGTGKHLVELWDVQKQVCLRQMHSHRARVGSLSWNGHLLSSGSRSGEVHNHDVRVAQHHVATLRGHTQEVCGLKWSVDARYLASGANDNLVAVWDASMVAASHASASSPQQYSQPLHTLREHGAAVKALAWCPWQHNLLATGGGTADRHIKVSAIRDVFF